MINEILLAGIFFLGAILVQIIGTNFADWRNHNRRLEYLEREHKYKIKYLREKIFYTEKLEFFKEIEKEIENYLKIYYKLKLSISKENFEKVMNNIIPNLKKHFEKKRKEELKDILNMLKKTGENMEVLTPRGKGIFLQNNEMGLNISNLIINHAKIMAGVAEIIKNNFKENETRTQELTKLIIINEEAINKIIEEIKKEIKP